ncbi:MULTISPECIES: hypothetical protein [unclassified Brevundimonas]|uniref:hypothetical protein n=1 Tax=unclassified Brevundimonas TaxID=2622653 RepID=UPI003F9299C1
MAQQWTIGAARALLHQWNRRTVDAAVCVGALAADLDVLEAWLLDQKPASLAEAERLLELIAAHEMGAAGDLGVLCKVGGAVRNDIDRHRSRVELSFAPCASGPMAGRA